MKERWKVVTLDNRYSISDRGNVISRCFYKMPRYAAVNIKNSYRYIYVGGKHRRASRLVATHFIKNPLNKKEVNHLDGNKLNDYYKNLKWSTPSENVQHACDNGLWVMSSTGKESLRMSKVTIVKAQGKIFYGIIQAAKYFKLCRNIISNMAHGKCSNTLGIKLITESKTTKTKRLMYGKDK